jgi:hypothetical protein
MQHTIEDLIRRIEVMKDKAILVHRLRNEFAEISGKDYDHETCKRLIDDIQTLICFLPSEFRPQCDLDWYYGDNILQEKYKL